MRVFISYSHDSDAHCERVLGLSERLRIDGIETVLDRYALDRVADWPRWMMDELDVADAVVVVCTETYYRRFRGHEAPGIGRGVTWEGAIISQRIYEDHHERRRFLPIFFSHADEASIPEPLRPGNRFPLTSEAEYARFLDALRGQAAVAPGPVRPWEPKERQNREPLRFDADVPPQPPKVSVDRILDYVPTDLVGREVEMKLLEDSWAKVAAGDKDRPRVLTFVALGGEGKTSLVAKWVAELAGQDWLHCERAFAWSFYSQGTRDHNAASSDAFLKEALDFFGDPALAASSANSHDKGRRLAQLVGERRSLLILDGLEPLQSAPTAPFPGELKDQGVAALLKGLAANSRGLCVVTTRYSVPDLRAYRQTTAPEHELKHLPTPAGVDLLGRLGVHGSKPDLEKLVEDVKGHALTLNLLGSFLREAHGGDVRCRDRVRWDVANAAEQGGHAFHVMDAYVAWLESDGLEGQQALVLLRLMGLFDRPMSASCLHALRQLPVIPHLTEPLFEPKKKWLGLQENRRPLEVESLTISLARLEQAKLLTVNREHGQMASLDAHPLLREYFARELRKEHPQAWREAHGRLFDYLCGSVEHQPDTLEGLQPLYQAISHGCHAQRGEEAFRKVFENRVRRGNEGYSVKKLGAFGSDLGAAACFFDFPWNRVSPALSSSVQAWLLGHASFCLRALGRSSEAREPLRAGLEMAIEQEDWKNAAIRASNLSQLELSLGETKVAVETAYRGVEYAERSGDTFQRMSKRAALANALHLAGREGEARTLYQEVERMQGERQPGFPLLYSLQGFYYCDLLLAEADQAAWRRALDPAFEPPEDHLSSCAEVGERVRRTLEWVEDDLWLLDVALDRLTLARVSLYCSLLNGKGDGVLDEALRNAVDGLRRASSQHHLPGGLLTRARGHTLLNLDAEAKQDLDEAWEIAERGSMVLHQIDVLLHRARLFHNQNPYPWEGSARQDLNEARRLIEKHGYGRRKEELEDAEAAIQ